MPHSSLRRKLAFFLLLAFFTAPWAALAEQHAADRPPAELLGFAGRFWSFLTRVWNETGCYIDPDGRCLPGTSGAPAATIQSDTGCYIDPNGRCIP